MALNISEKVLCSMAESCIKQYDSMNEGFNLGKKAGEAWNKKFVKPLLKNVFKKLGKNRAMKVLKTLESFTEDEVKNNHDKCVKKLIAAMSSSNESVDEGTWKETDGGYEYVQSMSEKFKEFVAEVLIRLIVAIGLAAVIVTVKLAMSGAVIAVF